MLMAIVPGKADGVFADRLHFGRSRRSLEHGQSSRDRLDRITRLARVTLAFFVAQCAGAGIAKKRKRINAAMTVLPLDLHTGAGGYIHFYGFWIGNQVHKLVGSGYLMA